MRRSLAVLSVLGAVGVLAAGGCGASSTTSSPTVAPAATSAESTVTLGPAAAPSTTVAGTNPFTTGPVPAVTGATDLTKQPTVAAGVGQPPSTLTGKDLVVGTGPMPVASSSVKVQYVGALYTTGTVFDASWTDQGPATFPVSGVVPGFADALLGMKVGGRREVVIPPDLGYGAAGSPPAIPPNATLVFVIDLLSVTP